MSHSLGLRVVAEGVETEEQLRFLQDLRCDEIQGYLISKPVPSEQASNLLAQSSSVQQMIKDYGANYPESTHHQGVGLAAGMMGILNDFPAVATEPLQQEKFSAGRYPQGAIESVIGSL